MASQIKIKGLNETISKLKAFGKEAEKLIDFETESTAIDIERDAKQRSPKNFGKLQQSISHSKPKELQRKVTVNELYGAYMEFGTGKKVVVPAEFKEIANEFKGKKAGTFEQGLESITIWMKSKGMDTKNAKWFFIKLLGAGINPSPFLYPAYVTGKKNYQKRLEGLLKSFNKKI